MITGLVQSHRTEIKMAGNAFFFWQSVIKKFISQSHKRSSKFSHLRRRHQKISGNSCWRQVFTKTNKQKWIQMQENKASFNDKMISKVQKSWKSKQKKAKDQNKYKRNQKLRTNYKSHRTRQEHEDARGPENRHRNTGKPAKREERSQEVINLQVTEKKGRGKQTKTGSEI